MTIFYFKKLKCIITEYEILNLEFRIEKGRLKIYSISIFQILNSKFYKNKQKH